MAEKDQNLGSGFGVGGNNTCGLISGSGVGGNNTCGVPMGVGVVIGDVLHVVAALGEPKPLLLGVCCKHSPWRRTLGAVPRGGEAAARGGGGGGGGMLHGLCATEFPWR